MKQKYKNWILCLTLAMGLAGCGGNADNNPPSQPTATEAEEKPQGFQALAYAAAFDKARDGNSVQIEGYASLPSMIYSTSDRSQIDLYERPNMRHGRYISASIAVGDCKSCMASLPSNYTLKDLKIKADDGSLVQPGQRLRLSGDLTVSEALSSTSGLSVSLRVSKIEVLPDANMDYKTVEALKITADNLLDSTLVDVMSYAEGKLAIPSMLFMRDDISLDMAFGDKNLYVSFAFGSGPNQIEDIPENYTKADFKIHDANGKVVNLNKPVKVWGIRSKPGTDHGGFLYVEHIEQ